MTPEELREKVADVLRKTDEEWWIRDNPNDPNLSEVLADAAIRVVLQIVLEQEGKQKYDWGEIHYVLSDHIRSLLPQDKQEDAA